MFGFFSSSDESDSPEQHPPQSPPDPPETESTTYDLQSEIQSINDRTLMMMYFIIRKEHPDHTLETMPYGPWQKPCNYLVGQEVARRVQDPNTTIPGDQLNNQPFPDKHADEFLIETLRDDSLSHLYNWVMARSTIASSTVDNNLAKVLDSPFPSEPEKSVCKAMSRRHNNADGTVGDLFRPEPGDYKHGLPDYNPMGVDWSEPNSSQSRVQQ